MAERFIHGLSMDEDCNQESCDPPICPNSCSEHGVCNANTGKCECKKGFEGEDCNIVHEIIDFGKTHEYTGYIFGNNYALYHLTFGQDGGVGLYDVVVYLNKTSVDGKLHMYLSAGSNYTTPSHG